MYRFIGKTCQQSSVQFVCIEAEPYLTKKGKQSAVLTWEAHCPECGSPFEVKSGPRVDPSKFPLRCKQHRKPGVRVVKKTVAAKKREAVQTLAGHTATLTTPTRKGD